MSHKQKYYDKRKFGENVSKRHRIILETIKKFDKKFERVLDLGCGSGYYLIKMKEELEIAELYGADISKNSINEANKLGINGSCLDLDKDVLPYHDNSLDLIISIDVIEHLFNPDLYLKEINRVLKPGGLFFIVTPNLGWWFNIIGLLGGFQPYYTETSLNTSYGHIKGGEYNFGHIRHYTKKGLTRLLESHDFKLKKTTGIEFLFRNNFWMVFDKLISHNIPHFSCHLCCILTKEE